MATAEPKSIVEELPTGLTVEQFLEWSSGRTGRFELHDGYVVAMAAEQLGHARVKNRVLRELEGAIRKGNLQCEALPDGVAVQIDERSWYEPDAMVYCGPEQPGDRIKLEQPVIVVEVTSPSTGRIDETRKLMGYMMLPSLQHYLIVDPDSQCIIHFERQSGNTMVTRIVRSGTIRLDPPGLDLDVERCFA